MGPIYPPQIQWLAFGSGPANGFAASFAVCHSRLVGHRTEMWRVGIYIYIIRGCLHRGPWSRPKAMWKICDWLLNSSGDHFGFHQGRIVKAVMEFEVSKRHVLRSTVPIDMVHWVLWRERQKRCYGRKGQGSMAKKCCYNKISMIFYLGEREDEDKRIQESGQTWFFFRLQKLPFWGTYKKIIHSYFGAWSILFGPHLVYT